MWLLRYVWKSCQRYKAKSCFIFMGLSMKRIETKKNCLTINYCKNICMPFLLLYAKTDRYLLYNGFLVLGFSVFYIQSENEVNTWQQTTHEVTQHLSVSKLTLLCYLRVPLTPLLHPVFHPLLFLENVSFPYEIQ